MIAYLYGKIKIINFNWLILDVNGIGYKVYLKAQSSKLKTGEKVEFYIYQHIREDRSELYGFEVIEELQMFELLLTVNGVGPKMALNILSHSGLKELKNSIGNGDTVLLTAIGGVGRKIAQKIIMELKNKIGKNGDADIRMIMENGSDVLDALLALGYKKSEIIHYLAKIPLDLRNTEEKVKWVLKEINRK